MKSAYLLFIFSCFLWQNQVLVSAQLSFSQLYMNPSNAGTVTTASNGILVNVKPNNDHGFILSDAISITTTPTEFYVTVVCTNTAVDYGLTLAPDAFSLQEAVSDSMSNLFAGNFFIAWAGLLNLFYPARPQNSMTSVSYIPALGEPVRFTLTAYSGSDYYEVKIRDMAGNYLMETPYNPEGIQPNGNSYFLSYLQTTSTSTFGFEVLNCGQAIFCVQTAAQVLANPGNCDGGATTSSSCSSTTCSTYQICSGSTPLIQNSACVAACGAGATEKPGKICEACTGTGCDTCELDTSLCLSCSSNLFLSGSSCVAQCPAATPYTYLGKCWKSCPSEAPLSYNSACYSTCPAGTSASSATTCALTPLSCTSPCSTCSGLATTCTACDNTAPLLYNSACYSTCPTGTYANSATTCALLVCTSPCSTCSGGPTTCTACDNSAPRLYNSACYSTCPAGSYANSATTCAACTSPCSACSGAPTTCTACDNSAPRLYNNACYSTCPAGSYANSATTCAACTSPCSACSGGATTCTACDNSAPLLYNNACSSTCPSAAPLSYNGVCYSTCPAGTTASSDTTCSIIVTESQSAGSGSGSDSDSGSHRVLGIALGTCLGVPFVSIAGYFGLKYLKRRSQKAIPV